jgi:hypothetical protein
MIKPTFFVSSFYLNNQKFDISDEVSIRNDYLYGFSLLKEKLKTKDIDLNMQDIDLSLESQLII